MLRWIRRVIGLTLLAWAVLKLLESWLTRPLVGVMPWGDLTGLRVMPLDGRSAAEARSRERELLAGWTGVDTVL